MSSTQTHWNKIFEKTDNEKLGWFEENGSQTMKLLNSIPDWKTSKIFVPGVGTSVIIKELLKTEANLILNDISPEAIAKAKQYCRNNEKIEWLCQDISDPFPNHIKDIDIWLDRAVLHFLTQEREITGYFNNLFSVVKIGGYALFAEFSKVGATMCAGLDVKRYSGKDLKERLPGFELVASEDYIYYNPQGDVRPYVYALFKRFG